MAELRTAVQLYRDCLKLANYLGTKGANAAGLRMHLRAEFKKNKGESNPEKVAEMKSSAVRGLQNYLLHEATSRVRETVAKQPPPTG
mmetsp:Transcript_8104/g.13900  ORF Transcript_8104/g.13900 Transcript_8104/m.13900 type:complete len:87 (-) Transcript_8104:495-755(-)